ncbi:MAG: M90 family metallopeptidase [Planctomycetota bacterium]|jgi:Mlc titration factor MtfA (ptsG expression regulator)
MMKIVYYLIPVGVLVILYAIFRSISKRNARKKLLAVPISEDWKLIIEKNVPLYRRLPQQLKEQLHGLVNVFIAEKRFEGCGGLELSDQIKVTIAAQACILLLNRPSTRMFRKLKTILVYPHTYVARQNGVESIRLGESWQNGPVILAWDSVTGGAMNITDGRNVVLHEFSHQLDQEDGSADGAPVLKNRSSYKTWARVLSTEYEVLMNKTKKHRRSVINKYGAVNPAEFFAVITETFFEKSKQLKRKHPELYDELKGYYKMDPAEWA